MPSRHYILTILTVSTAGIPKGYDEGGFSASITLPSFKSDYNLLPAHWTSNPSGLANRSANITSLGVLGAAFGALALLFLNDRLGRLRAWRLAVLVWATGLIVQVFASGVYGVLLLGRVWSGLGAGGLTVAGPMFLSEVAGARTRGRVVGIYMVVLLTALSLGFFVNYGASLHMAATRMQYRLVQAVPLIPTGIAFLVSFALRDTPRWLISKDRCEAAKAELARLRGLDESDPDLLAEFDTIRSQSRIESESPNIAATPFWSITHEVFSTPTYRTRFLLVLTMHTVAQWSGGNGITYYITNIFSYAGISGSSTSLISSGAYGVVKLVFTIAFAWWFIDIVGRRRCFIAGLSLQLVAHIYMAVYMSQQPGSADNKTASNAAIASVFVYAVGWSIGLCTIPYIYGAEVFPTRIRSACYAVLMAVHWFFQFAVVRVTPNMFVSLDVWGAYVFWAAICAVGLVLLGLWAPETKGVPMEKMDLLFEGPWWRFWKAKLSLSDRKERWSGWSRQSHRNGVG
ncbi:general substrate transporter [Saccharata proteae CBS 121410]|uniref:General substrate transporter n=1 Tax=Saccharata proteae CBS 121410 TaxID=1314787 RepID=A0A9P4HYW9_9PEZI|nr:general substrate transporter [Saccharata proteae CBS 121410]